MSTLKLGPFGPHRLLGIAACLLSVFGAGLSGAIALSPGVTAQQSPTPGSPEEQRVRSEIRDLERILTLPQVEVADRGAALYLLVKRYARLGEMEKALELLKQCIALDEGFDPEHARELQPLNSRPDFKALVARVLAKRDRAIADLLAVPG